MFVCPAEPGHVPGIVIIHMIQTTRFLELARLNTPHERFIVILAPRASSVGGQR